MKKTVILYSNKKSEQNGCMHKSSETCQKTRRIKFGNNGPGHAYIPNTSMTLMSYFLNTIQLGATYLADYIKPIKLPF